MIVYDKMIQERIDELEERIESFKDLNDDLVIVKSIVPEDMYIWLDYEINVDFPVKSFDEVKAMLKLFAENGMRLKEYSKSDTSPTWQLQGINTTIRLRPQWFNEDSVVEGATCKLVKVGETVSTYPKYKLVCDGKEIDYDQT